MDRAQMLAYLVRKGLVTLERVAEEYRAAVAALLDGEAEG